MQTAVKWPIENCLICRQGGVLHDGFHMMHCSSLSLLHNFIPVKNFVFKRVGKVCIRDRWSIRPALISGFCDMKRLGVFLLPPGWDASSSQVTTSIKFAGSHFYTWVERDTVRVTLHTAGAREI